MASLTGTQINNTYVGLIKMTDNLGVDGTPRELTTGDGASLPMEVAVDRINFYDTVDFTNATVLGISGGAAGLVNGTGANSLKNADSLVDDPADASANNTIAIGPGAQARAAGAISIGHDSGGSGTSNWGSISIGNNSTVSGFGAVAIGGGNNEVTGNSGIAIGDNAKAGSDGTSIGRLAVGNNAEAVNIGAQNTSNNFTTVAIGQNNTINGSDCQSFGTNTQNNGSVSFTFGNNHNVGSGNQNNVVLGGDAVAVPAGTNDYVGIGRVNSPTGNSYNSICIGLVSEMNNSSDAVSIGRSAACTNAPNSVAIGNSSSATAGNSVALGYQVTANRSNFVTVNELEVTVVGGGIIMPSPDGTLYKLTIANGGTVTVSAV
jgi:hypothetical protein